MIKRFSETYLRPRLSAQRQASGRSTAPPLGSAL
jgi:hypothetical protein